MNHLSLGRHGEDIACRHLRLNGYRIITRNFRTRLGEIDIIAEEQGALVFVEVKTRMGAGFCDPLEAVSRKKCRQISRVALEYVEKEGKQDQVCRFDVVGVTLKQGAPPQVETVRDAFELSYGI
jgi:putative endonuclease